MFERLRKWMAGPDPAAFEAAVLAKAAPLRRTCHVAVTEPGPGRSQVYGLPELGPDGWPECSRCRERMPLFLQIEEPEGLLQLFFCTGDCHSGNPGSGAARVRLLAEGVPATDGPAFEARRIVRWDSRDDYPIDPEGFDEAEREALGNLGYPRDGTKRGGWPDWIQGEMEASCPRCRGPMQFLLQFEPLPGYELGDAGMGYLFRCPEHPEYLDFGWQGH